MYLIQFEVLYLFYKTLFFVYSFLMGTLCPPPPVVSAENTGERTDQNFHIQDGIGKNKNDIIILLIACFCKTCEPIRLDPPKALLDVLSDAIMERSHPQLLSKTGRMSS